jgi:hypothetical protein
MNSKNLLKTIIPIVIVIIGIIEIYIFIKQREPFEDTYTVDLVIARYKESLDYFEKMKNYPLRNVYIYNKSGKHYECPAFFKNCSVVDLPNVGVCDHTYLYHIITQFNDIPNMTIFLPASVNAVDYKRDKIDTILKRVFEDKSPVISAYRLPDGITTYTDKNLNDFSVKSWEVSDKTNRDSADITLVEANPRPFGKWYRKYFPDKNVSSVSLMGMFAVTRNMIHDNPLNLYKDLMDTLTNDKFPEAAHYMERSWSTLFRDIPIENNI